ncbi:MAG: hypothetical protein QOJ84_1840 [Bradyrhizobium sp.]|nr:hypothetical protein [Bradyrhizobium sp.]
MSYRLLTVALMASSVAFATQSYAAKNLNSSRSNIYREGTPKTGPAAMPTTVKSSKSNSSDRMGGGGGGKGAAKRVLTVRKAGGSALEATTVKSSKSNSSDRMGGGGGGKGAVRLNPQPEPPGRR